jgi:hypothetical protein
MATGTWTGTGLGSPAISRANSVNMKFTLTFT